MSKERSSLSITALNGLRAVEDGVRNESGLSNVAVNKGMLVSVKSSHKAYLAHIKEERMKILKRENLLQKNSRKGKPREGKKRNCLRKSIKELHERESKAFEMLQSACAFLEEGNERMAKGVADKNMNEIEAVKYSIHMFAHGTMLYELPNNELTSIHTLSLSPLLL